MTHRPLLILAVLIALVSITSVTARPHIFSRMDCPLRVQVVQDTTACLSEFPPPHGSSSPVQFSVTAKVTGGVAVAYAWSNGQTGPKLFPAAPGYYSVTVTHQSGCEATAGVMVREWGADPDNADFSFSSVCLGDTTEFAFTPASTIDKIAWSFGDGNSLPPSKYYDYKLPHVYTGAASFPVSMHLTNRCGYNQTITKSITINPLPPLPTIPGAAALCNGPVALDANAGNAPGLTYAWSSGDISRTITVANASIVSVTVKDANGCKSVGQTLVADNRPLVNLGPEITVCQNAVVLALTAQRPGASYAWSINGITASTLGTISVNSGTLGDFLYKVVVTDDVTACSGQATKMIHVTARPSVSLSSNAEICEGSSIALSASGADSFAWSPASSLSSATGATVVATPSSTTTYTVTGTTQGCPSTALVKVTVGPSIARPSISSTGNTLMSSTAFGNQWFREGTLIPGATNQTLSITQTGHYSVQVSANQCKSEMSEMFNATSLADNPIIVVTGVSHLSAEGNLTLYPNPVENVMQICGDGFDEKVAIQIAIVDLTGISVLTACSKLGESVDVQDLPRGCYILKAEQGSKIFLSKFVKKAKY